MSSAHVILVVMWLGLTAYVLLGGADFGGGFWDLVAGGVEGGRAQRDLIAHSIGPIWEANHVWLIFVLVVLWTAFPAAFASVASTLIVPLTLAAFGIIARGAAFAFRKEMPDVGLQRLFGAAFAASSVLTPFFLGTVAGAVASGRVPVGNAAGDLIGSWANPTSVLGGTLAVGVSAYLAAVYLTRDAERTGDTKLTRLFRSRALASGVVVGAIALGGIAVLARDAPRLFAGLTGRALPLIVASALGGVSSLLLVWHARFTAARAAAALAVAAVIWGWAVAQYPEMLVGHLTILDAAAPPATLDALLWTLVVGGVILVPSLLLLFALFQRTGRRNEVDLPPLDHASEAVVRSGEEV
ncbi:MAG: cytochrome d ubiquinol oxidase subunit II [Actinomycetota bacterium]|nr:cytochrome d ubiquinol oxidase subunit II [Actinomycetota bacterium]